jgi:hypothetical protein
MRPTIITKRGQRIETTSPNDAGNKIRQALGFPVNKPKGKGKS